MVFAAGLRLIDNRSPGTVDRGIRQPLAQRGIVDMQAVAIDFGRQRNMFMRMVMLKLGNP
jgi:hypothetical protein